MYYYKAIVKYQGSRYSGFQWQNGLATVQDEINNALASISSDKLTTIASSRTDSGVHALNQVIKITTNNPLNPTSALAKINLKLPSDIRFLHIEECLSSFRPTRDCIKKEYRYFFTNNIKTSSDKAPFIANISNSLDLEIMQECANALIGNHDFCNFYSQGSNVKSTVREIFICNLTEINPHFFFQNDSIFDLSPNVIQCYQLQIEANGFLKQMIRHIVSALWMVGSGKMQKEFFLQLIDGPKSEKQLWKVAPANGLFLCTIHF